MRNSIRIAVLGALMLGATGMASAATSTGTLTANANVSPECVILPATLNFVFSPADVANGIDQYATTPVSVQCTVGAVYTVAMDNGQHYSFNLGTAGIHNGEATRTMMGATLGNYVGYRVYTDAAHTIEWNSVNTVGGTGDGLAKLFTAYGRVLGGQIITPDNYQDVDALTATF
jgi:spore coat protein U-like protein